MKEGRSTTLEPAEETISAAALQRKKRKADYDRAKVQKKAERVNLKAKKREAAQAARRERDQALFASLRTAASLCDEDNPTNSSGGSCGSDI